MAPELVGRVLGVHNGKRFVRVRVSEDMVGHKLGEFVPTRKMCTHAARLRAR